MKRIFLKSAGVAMASVFASFVIALILMPALGGALDGIAWLMLTICPLAIAWPASALSFWQRERLRNAHRQLARAHAELAAAHRRLEEKASRDTMTGMLNRESSTARVTGPTAARSSSSTPTTSRRSMTVSAI